MEMDGLCSNGLVLDGFLCSVVQAVVAEAAIAAAAKSLALSCLMMGSVPNNINVFPKEPEAVTGFPITELYVVEKPGPENKDASETEDDDDDDDDAAGDDPPSPATLSSETSNPTAPNWKCRKMNKKPTESKTPTNLPTISPRFAPPWNRGSGPSWTWPADGTSGGIWRRRRRRSSRIDAIIAGNLTRVQGIWKEVL